VRLPLNLCFNYLILFKALLYNFFIYPLFIILPFFPTLLKQRIIPCPNTYKKNNMGFKHLIGFCLLVVGVGLVPLFFAFLAHSDMYDPIFLRCLAGGALAFSFSGLLILNKAR